MLISPFRASCPFVKWSFLPAGSLLAEFLGYGAGGHTLKINLGHLNAKSGHF